MVASFRFLILLSLDLYFVSEVHLDSGVHDRGSGIPSVSLCSPGTDSQPSILHTLQPYGGPWHKHRESQGLVYMLSMPSHGHL